MVDGMALEPIRLLAVTDPDRADVQRRVVDTVQADPERFLTAYAAHKDSFGGRYVCADLMKDVIPEYAASKETRGRYNAVVHNAAAVLAAEQYRRVIADDSDPNRNRALFVTGMPGAGKTSTVQATAMEAGGRIGDDVRVIFEGQLVNAESSIEKVQQALDAGCVVSIAAVLPRAEQALEFSFKRFEEYGRGAGVGVMTQIQEGTPRGLSVLLERFGDKVTIGVYDVRDRDNPARHEGPAGIKVWNEELSHGSVRDRLNAEFERRRAAGLVSADCGRQFQGQPPYPDLFQVRGRDAERGSRPEPEPDPARRGSSQNLLSGEKELQNGPDPRFADGAARQAHGQAPLGEHRGLVGRGDQGGEQSGQKPGLRDEGGRSTVLGRALFEAARGSTVGGLAAAVPAGRGTIPEGAEQVVVMNGSRLHESRHDGEWVVQKSDPQGMLPRGVFRLDTASPAKPDDGTTYVGSILHVSAKGVYQVHGNGVARHDPSRFERVPSIGASPKITYANGRATIEGRGPDLPAKGRSI